MPSCDSFTDTVAPRRFSAMARTASMYALVAIADSVRSSDGLAQQVQADVDLLACSSRVTAIASGSVVPAT